MVVVYGSSALPDLDLHAREAAIFTSLHCFDLSSHSVPLSFTTADISLAKALLRGFCVVF